MWSISQSAFLMRSTSCCAICWLHAALTFGVIKSSSPPVNDNFFILTEFFWYNKIRFIESVEAGLKTGKINYWNNNVRLSVNDKSHIYHRYLSQLHLLLRLLISLLQHPKHRYLQYDMPPQLPLLHSTTWALLYPVILFWKRSNLLLIVFELIDIYIITRLKYLKEYFKIS